MPANLTKTEKPKKIAVVGAGPAGIVVAITAAKRGHSITIFEKNSEIGGKIISGSIPRIKYELDNYRKYLQYQLDKAVKNGSVIIKYNTEITANELKEQKFDSIVTGIGTKAFVPPLNGIEKANAIQAIDLLCNPTKIGKAKKAVIVGGGVVGCETAYWLKYEHGLDVKVVEMMPYFMEGVCTANRGHLIHYMKKEGVELLNCAKVTGFTETKVSIAKNISKGVPDPYNTWQPILPKNIENPLAKKIGTEEKEIVLDVT
jgi:2-enoate reductase